MGQAIIVIVGVTIIVFALRHLLPGSIARAIIGPQATPQQVATFNRENGLNRPLPWQYVSFLNQIIHGNLGYSFKQNMSVDAIVAHDLPNDALLVGASIVLALGIAIPVGVLQAVRRDKLADYAATGISFVLYSMPSYLLGLLLIAVFAVNLRLLPAEAPTSWANRPIACSGARRQIGWDRPARTSPSSSPRGAGCERGGECRPRSSGISPASTTWGPWWCGTG